VSDEGSQEQQVLRYAADLARLYARAAEDRRQLGELQASLVRLSEAALHVSRALSLEESAERLAHVAADELGLEWAAVYLHQRGRLGRVARRPADAPAPAIAPVEPDDLDAVGVDPDELPGPPWAGLTGDSRPAVVLPLLGRRRAVGFVVGPGPLPAPTGGSRLPLLRLLAGHAGTVLENHLIESRREGTTALAARAAGSDDGMIGRSPPIEHLRGLVGRLAGVDSTVLIGGESGTGKSLVAKALHAAGPRRAKPFVTVNCPAIPEQLVESELFGHEAGAFTGAVRAHRGKVEQASGGTLFLDEIGDLPLPVQAKLLTFLEERRFTRVGGEKELEADVRIVAASNSDLDELVAEKRFRSDLLYRLKVFNLVAPPLRERGEDVVLLAGALGAEIASRYDLEPPELDGRARERLMAYPWPGNVRELRNVIEKAVILSGGGPVPVELLPEADGRAPRPVEAGAPPAEAAAAATPAAAATTSLAEPSVEQGVSYADARAQMIEDWERGYVEALLRSTGGNVSQAARLAQVDRKHLHNKARQLGIDIEALRG